MPYTVIGALGDMEVGGGSSCQNPCAAMTLNNCVLLCGDWDLPSCKADQPFAVLPREEMFPRRDMEFPMVCEVDFNGRRCFVNTYMTVTALGEMSVPLDGHVRVLSNGAVLNMSDRWYNQEIGNSSGEGTSPLTEK